MNRYKTTEFIGLIHDMMRQGHVAEAFETINDCLPQNNPLRKELILLESDFKWFRTNELLGLGVHSVEKTQRSYGLLNLLEHLKKEYPKTIPLKATPFVRERLERVVENKVPAARQSIQKSSPNGGVFLVLLAGLAAVLIFTPQFCSKKDPEASRAAYNGEPFQWAALLEDSTDETYITGRFKQFRGRSNLEILFVEKDNSYWLVLLGENWTEDFVIKKISKSKNIREAWPDAKPIDLSAECNGLKRGRGETIWRCN